MDSLTIYRLRELLSYDPATGDFHWRDGRQRNRAGAIAGTPNAKGYLRIKIDQRRYMAHRLAWFYVYGQWPLSHLDHRDRVKSHNAIANLRPASVSQNGANTNLSSRNKSGLKGVYFFKRTGRWRAELKKDGKRIFSGYFDTAEEAHSAYAAAANEHFGEYANAG